MTIWSLIRQPTVDASKGEEHLGPGGGELAVAEHGELGIVDAAQVEGLREGGKHPVRPAIAGVPQPDQVREGDTAGCEVVSKTQVIRIRIATMVNE